MVIDIYTTLITWNAFNLTKRRGGDICSDAAILRLGSVPIWMPCTSMAVTEYSLWWNRLKYWCTVDQCGGPINWLQFVWEKISVYFSMLEKWWNVLALLFNNITKSLHEIRIIRKNVLKPETGLSLYNSMYFN